MRMDRKKRLLRELPTTRSEALRVAIVCTALVAVMGLLTSIGLATDALTVAHDPPPQALEWAHVGASASHRKMLLDERRVRFERVAEGNDVAHRSVGDSVRSWRVSSDATTR